MICFDGNNIGVEVGNGVDDVVEFWVIYVGMNLCVVFDFVGI